MAVINEKRDCSKAPRSPKMLLSSCAFVLAAGALTAGMGIFVFPAPETERLDAQRHEWIQELPPPDQDTIDYLASIDLRTLRPRSETPEPESPLPVGAMAVYERGGCLTHIAYSPDGEYFATGHTCGSVSIRHTITGSLQKRLPIFGTLGSLRFTDDCIVALARYEGKRCWIELHDISKGAKRHLVSLTDKPLERVALSTKCRFAATAENGSIALWDISTGVPVLARTLEIGGKVNGLEFSGDDKMLAAAYGSHCRVWDVATGKVLAQITFANAHVWNVLFSPDNGMLALQANGLVHIWDVAGQRLKPGKFPVQQRKRHRAFAFSHDSGSLAAATGVQVSVWNLATSRRRHQFFSEDWCMAFTPNGRTLATGGYRLHLWNLSNRSGLTSLAYSLSTEELRKLAHGVATPRQTRAYMAILSLMGAPPSQPSVPQHPAMPAKRMQELIAQLGSRSFKERERASQELLKVAYSARDLLFVVLAGKPDLETQRRIERILHKTSWPVRANRRFQFSLQLVKMLEQIGNAEAKKILKRIAQSAPDPGGRKDAAAALGRLTSGKKGE